jgi:hypothetical protein
MVMITRKRVILCLSITGFIAGAVLLGVGTSGAATPLIVAGVILVLASGAGGFMGAMEPPPLRPLTSRRSSAAQTTATS